MDVNDPSESMDTTDIGYVEYLLKQMTDERLRLEKDNTAYAETIEKLEAAICIYCREELGDIDSIVDDKSAITYFLANNKEVE